MSRARVGVLTVTLRFPGSSSLKEKRSRLRPILDRIRNKFPVSVAEISSLNARDQAVIAAAVVGSAAAQLDRTLAAVERFIETFDTIVEDVQTEVI